MSRFRSFLILLLLLPYTVSYSESGGQISVRNETGKYLHVIVNGTPHLYVGPGGIVSVSAEAGAYYVTALYSPGQDLDGAADTTVRISREVTNPAGCQSTSGNTCSCSTDAESGASVSYTSAVWTVKPETLAGGAQ